MVNIEIIPMLLLDVNFPFLCGHLLRLPDNDHFLKGMKNLVEKSSQKLKICSEYMNRGDRWIQVKQLYRAA